MTSVEVQGLTAAIGELCEQVERVGADVEGIRDAAALVALVAAIEHVDHKAAAPARAAIEGLLARLVRGAGVSK